MISRLSTLFLIVVISGCGLKYEVLKNGYTKVPRNDYKFENKQESVTLGVIPFRTDCIYEELSNFNNQPARKDVGNKETFFYETLRFYDNGCINIFLLNRDNVNIEFNPEFFGYRGVYYSVNNRWKFDLFAPQSERAIYGIISGEISLNGDTISLIRENGYQNRFVIHEIEKLNLIEYSANW
jgi:hypothetical protein